MGKLRNSARRDHQAPEVVPAKPKFSGQLEAQQGGDPKDDDRATCNSLQRDFGSNLADGSGAQSHVLEWWR